MSETTPGPAGTAADMAAGVERISELQLGMMQTTGTGRRGQHYKPHGCVVAQFEVLADLPDGFRTGLFAVPRTYTAYVRFSNGGQLDDTHADVHGMAIKLTGVPGDKLLDAERTAQTHDFVLADKPVFFIRDLDSYVRFVENLAATFQSGQPPMKFLGWLSQNHPEDLPIVQHFVDQRPDSPLAATYWSQVPYALGAEPGVAVRYAAVPHGGNLGTPIPQADRGADYLQRAMRDQLTAAGRPAVFDFLVQRRVDADQAVIDNPTVEWDAPMQRVATITIPPQTFDSAAQMRFCEALSYTPWHALPEHRPLGQINAIRRTVYVASSTLRHGVTHEARAEPTGTEHLGFNLPPSEDEPAESDEAGGSDAE